MTPTPDMTQFEHENKIQMSKVFVGLCITTLCSLANAATMNVTFENQNITLRDINTKGSQTRTTERWGHVEIIGAGKVRASSILSLSLLFLIFEIKHKQNKNIYRNTNSSKHFLVEIYDVMPWILSWQREIFASPLRSRTRVITYTFPEENAHSVTKHTMPKWLEHLDW